MSKKNKKSKRDKLISKEILCGEINIRRFIDADGDTVIGVRVDDGDGGTLPYFEACGLLMVGQHHVLDMYQDAPDEDED